MWRSRAKRRITRGSKRDHMGHMGHMGHTGHIGQMGQMGQMVALRNVETRHALSLQGDRYITINRDACCMPDRKIFV
jgi:hypothetical protein